MVEQGDEHGVTFVLQDGTHVLEVQLVVLSFHQTPTISSVVEIDLFVEDISFRPTSITWMCWSSEGPSLISNSRTVIVSDTLFTTQWNILVLLTNSTSISLTRHTPVMRNLCIEYRRTNNHVTYCLPSQVCGLLKHKVRESVDWMWDLLDRRRI